MCFSYCLIQDGSAAADWLKLLFAAPAPCDRQANQFSARVAHYIFVDAEFDIVDKAPIAPAGGRDDIVIGILGQCFEVAKIGEFVEDLGEIAEVPAQRNAVAVGL